MTKFQNTTHHGEKKSSRYYPNSESIMDYRNAQSTETIDLQNIHSDQELAHNKDYCLSITRLRIHLVQEDNPEEIWNFFNSRPNIKFLEIKDYAIPLEKKNENLKHQPQVLPSCFAQLKVFKLGLVSVIAPPGSTEDHEEAFDIPSTHWTMNLLRYCPNLQRLGYPSLTTENSFKLFLENTNDSLKKKSELRLQSIDLERFSFDDLDDYSLKPNFHKFLSTCVSTGIRILNFDINFSDEEELNFRENGIGECIQSIFSLLTRPITFFSSYDLPNLDGIKIICCDWEDEDLCLTGNWPNLKSLSIDLEAESVDSPPSNCWKQVMEVLVYSELRPKVQDLSIRIAAQDKESLDDEESELFRLLRPNGRSHLEKKCIVFSRMIKIPLITANFPNLISLSMVGWNVSDDSLADLWGQLPNLKKLAISECFTASDFSFIGEDSESPAFLQLHSLEKLTLNLENMPNVTDSFFIDVLAKMKLKEFALESRKELENVTKRGLAALLRGSFATSIEDFTVEPGCISAVTNEDLIRLRNKLLSRNQ